MNFSFSVLDPETWKQPDCGEIALTEPWASNLIYSDIEGFAISEDGNLIMTDECGNFAYVPEGRFVVVLGYEM